MRRTFLFILILLFSNQAFAALTFYTDEAAYLSELAGLGYRVVTEDFEDDLVWGSVRTTISDPNYAPVIVSRSITWTSNHPENEVTTSSGAALTGSWGFYSMPHGNFSSGTDCQIPGMCGDGFTGTRLDTIYAVGGWVKGTFGGRLKVILDGDTLAAVDFNGANDLQSAHQFFGVIETNGFLTFEFREIEGVAEDQKFIWADDFTFGLPLSSAVMISSFDAVAVGPGVELAWRVSADEAIAGFRIYREESDGQDVLSLTGAGLLDVTSDSYVDTDVIPGKEYVYMLAVVRPDGSEVRSVEIKAVIGKIPASLRQNYPNPFNPVTTIGYFVDRESDVSLRVYDVNGRFVRMLMDSRMTPGEYIEIWDGRDAGGNRVESGIYFCRLRVGKATITRKMILLK